MLTDIERVYGMKQKDCFLSYSAKDVNLASQLREYLEGQGVSVWIAPNDIPIGSSYVDSISNAIRSCDYMIVLLSTNSVQSAWVHKEVEFAIGAAENRNKQIVPILVDDVKLTNSLLFYLASYQCIQVDTADLSWPESIAPFLQGIFLSKKKSGIYEELSELIEEELDSELLLITEDDSELYELEEELLEEDELLVGGTP